MSWPYASDFQNAHKVRPSSGATSTQERTGRLFRQDRLIVWNAVRATFAGWHDRVIVTIVLLAALAVVRAWFVDRTWTVAIRTALAAGTMIGFGAGRLVATRLAVHAFDGLLAADALQLR